MSACALFPRIGIPASADRSLIARERSISNRFFALFWCRNRLEEIRCGRAKLLGPSAMSALSRCTMLRVLEVHGVTWVSMEDIMQLKALTHLEVSFSDAAPAQARSAVRLKC